MTMLEKAARALHASLKAHKRYVSGFQDTDEWDKPAYEDGAKITHYTTTIDGDFDLMAVTRAVLLAIREPDEAMVVSICREAEKEQARPVAINRTDAALCWQTGINAILKEQ